MKAHAKENPWQREKGNDVDEQLRTLAETIGFESIAADLAKKSDQIMNNPDNYAAFTRNMSGLWSKVFGKDTLPEKLKIEALPKIKDKNKVDSKIRETLRSLQSTVDKYKHVIRAADTTTEGAVREMVAEFINRDLMPNGGGLTSLSSYGKAQERIKRIEELGAVDTTTGKQSTDKQSTALVPWKPQGAVSTNPATTNTSGAGAASSTALIRRPSPGAMSLYTGDTGDTGAASSTALIRRPSPGAMSLYTGDTGDTAKTANTKDTAPVSMALVPTTQNTAITKFTKTGTAPSGAVITAKEANALRLREMLKGVKNKARAQQATMGTLQATKRTLQSTGITLPEETAASTKVTQALTEALRAKPLMPTRDGGETKEVTAIDPEGREFKASAVKDGETITVMYKQPVDPGDLPAHIAALLVQMAEEKGTATAAASGGLMSKVNSAASAIGSGISSVGNFASSLVKSVAAAA
jgi:3-deoxy-D-manno-octulosonate 8-phosphate phosphatase KdsC-like HAD superfamily phosphatase